MPQSFKQWLQTNHYRESTVKVSLRHARAIQKQHALGNALPPSCKASAQRVVTFAVKEPDQTEFDQQILLYLRTYVEPASKLPKEKPKRRLLEARSMNDADWKRLRFELQSSRLREDRVLYVVLASGLRIGDVLRSETSILRQALQTGVWDVERKGGTFTPVPVEGLEAPLQALLDGCESAKAPTVAAYICKSNSSPLAGDAAYKRAARRLERLCSLTNVAGRSNLHRLRRTFAVRGLRATGDIVQVQQMLGHANITSTQKYTDEIRIADVAATRKKIHDL